LFIFQVIWLIFDLFPVNLLLLFEITKQR